jgi:hypothetical protein
VQPARPRPGCAAQQMVPDATPFCSGWGAEAAHAPPEEGDPPSSSTTAASEPEPEPSSTPVPGMLRGQRLQPPPLFQADRLLAALRAIQYLVYPEPSPPMSGDFVAFFNHLLSRTCSEVVARVVGGVAGTFKAAVEALFDGELAKHAVKEGETWTVDKGPPQVVALFEGVGGQWPTWLKPQLCGLADYVMAEILEVSTMAFRDGQRCSQGSACSKLCRQDARLLFQLTKEARNDATPAAPEAVRALLQWRYQPFPLIAVGSAISQDDELVLLCKKMLGEELGQCIHFPKQPQQQRPTASATVTSSAEYSLPSSSSLAPVMCHAACQQLLSGSSGCSS